MSGASKTDKTMSKRMSRKDILSDYMIEQEPYMGSEIETFVTTRKGGLITPAQSNDLMTAFAAAGLPVVREPLASLIEVKSSKHKKALHMMHEIAGIEKTFADVVRTQGYATEKSGFLGRFTLDEAATFRAPNERFDEVFEYFRNNGEDMAAHQPLMSSSVHLSLSYADIDHAYEMAKLLMVMTPVIVHLTDNAGELYEGKPCKFNPATTVRLSQGDGRGGLSTVISEAQSPEDLMKLQAAHLWNSPMMMHLDKHGDMRAATKEGKRPSLAELKAEKLNTASNVYLTESMQYQMLKLTSIRGADGKPKGKRLELRMADNGSYQHDFMAVVGQCVAFDAKFRKDLTKAFKKADLNPQAPVTAKRANKALAKVAARKIKFDYGDQSFADVGRLVLDKLEEHFGQHEALDEAAMKLAFF